MFFGGGDWGRLGDGELWTAAAVQALLSTSAGAGVMASIASFHDRARDFRIDALLNSAHRAAPPAPAAHCRPRSLCVPALVGALASVISGIAVFSVFGHLAQKHGVSITEVAETGPRYRARPPARPPACPPARPPARPRRRWHAAWCSWPCRRL
jgi:hypothetical protein